MDLILDDLELLLVSFGGDFAEIVRNFSLAESQDPFVFKVGA